MMDMRLCNHTTPILSRRDWLGRSGCGFGSIALAALAGRLAPHQAVAAPADAPPKSLASVPAQARLAGVPRAKRVLFLCMRGGPSHVDLFDYKPRLLADSGKPGPKPGSQWLGSKWRFKQHGKSGRWVSELLPKLAEQVDRMCFIPSMQTDLPAHPQAFIKLHTGTSQFIRPSLGAWTLYGLGSANENLPGFVSITPPSGFGGTTNYGSSFLPATYQGTRLGTDTRPIASATVANLQPRRDVIDQRAEIDFLQSLNREHAARTPKQPEVEGMIESFELAFRMQSEMPGVLDLRRESAATQARYGIGTERTDDMGRKCLLARRMLEAGVRFVEVTHGNWDHHFNLNSKLEASCGEIDRPIAALLADMHERGLLDDTLVVWSGEFGRTPYAEGQEGRDHNVKAFTLWLAGGGVQPGMSYGLSDDYGYEAIEHPVEIADLHATMLAAIGLNHLKLTFRHAGRDFRLTDTKGRVVKEILA